MACQRAGPMCPEGSDGPDVRDQLSVEDGVHSEAGRLGDELDLIRAEVKPCLYVRARDAQHGAAGQPGDDRAVHVTGYQPGHLRVPPNHLTECPAIGGGQADVVPTGDTGVARERVGV